MDNQQILAEAINRAVNGGWKYPFQANCYTIRKHVKSKPEVIAFGFKENWQDGQRLKGQWSIPELIFNHDLAKALWGKEKQNYAPIGLLEGWDDDDFLYDDIKETWQYHLQQMVIADDPIKYLGENI